MNTDFMLAKRLKDKRLNGTRMNTDKFLDNKMQIQIFHPFSVLTQRKFLFCVHLCLSVSN